MRILLQIGETCSNPDCPQHGLRCPEKIIKFGHSKAGRQRDKCQVCDKTFTSTTRTLFYHRRTSPDEIVNALGQLAEGARISRVARTTGHKEETVSSWLVAASSQAALIDEGLLAKSHISEGSLTASGRRWATKGKKKDYAETAESGQFFRSTMIDVPTRLRVAHGIGKTRPLPRSRCFRPYNSAGARRLRPRLCQMVGWHSRSRVGRCRSITGKGGIRPGNDLNRDGSICKSSTIGTPKAM